MGALRSRVARSAAKSSVIVIAVLVSIAVLGNMFDDDFREWLWAPRESQEAQDPRPALLRGTASDWRSASYPEQKDAATQFLREAGVIFLTVSGETDSRVSALIVSMNEHAENGARGDMPVRDLAEAALQMRPEILRR